MGVQRTYRLLFACLSVVLAGFLAIAVKSAPSPDRTRVASGFGPSAVDPHLAPAPPMGVSAAPPPPRREHPLQSPVEPAGDAAVGTTVASGLETASRDRPPIPRGPTTEAAKNVYGVIIGINDYPGDAYDLHGAVADAEDMSDVLAMYGVPAENVKTLLDQDAIAPSISDALDWLVSSTHPDSTVVFFYAGHVRKLNSDTEAVLAADGSVLPDWYLAKKLETLPAQDAWIVMAACYGGGFTEMLAPGRVLTAAADANSLAYENESFGRSYLDEYLIHQAFLEQLAAGPTAQQAFAYAQAALQRDYPDRTLTQFDESSEAISLDGVHRGTPSSPSPNDPSGGDQPIPPVPPTTSPSPPEPCRNLLGLLCPPGSR